MYFIKYILFTSLIFVTTSIAAQKKISFKAEIDAKEVVAGNYFQITFTMHNGEFESFKLPKELKQFEQIGGRSQSTSSSFVNGKWSGSTSYTYVFLGRKPGTYKISPATARYRKKNYRSNPLSLKIVKGKGKTAKSREELLKKIDEEVFLRAEVSKDTLHIGEQVYVDFKIYTSVGIDGYHMVTEPEFKGFFKKEIKQFNGQVIREVLDGVQYSTKILRRIALFPQQAGQLEITPMNMRVDVVTGEKRQRRFGLFNRPQTIPKNVQTEPLAIKVATLPTGAPAGFSGAVGQYKTFCDYDKAVLSTDDALTLRMVITGNGDPKRVQAPDLKLGDKFEVYEPAMTEDMQYEESGEAWHKKVYEYMVVPKERGNHIIEPAFAYYNPDSSAYLTARPQKIALNVKQGKNRRRKNVAPGKASDGIRFIKTDQNLYKKENPFFGSLPFWVLLLLPVLGLIGALLYKQKQIKADDVDWATLQQQRATKVAQGRLEKARTHQQKNEHRQFYDEVVKAQWGYVSDKLLLQPSELSKSNVREKLSGLKVSESHIDQFLKIIQTCEMALFAGMDNSSEMEKTYQSALEVIANIEKEVSGNES